MQTKFWIRRIVLAAVWGLAVATWASIGHYLFGMPDVALILAVATMVFIMVRPAGRASEANRRSSVGEPAMQRGTPTA